MPKSCFKFQQPLIFDLERPVFLAHLFALHPVPYELIGLPPGAQGGEMGVAALNLVVLTKC